MLVSHVPKGYSGGLIHQMTGTKKPGGYILSSHSEGVHCLFGLTFAVLALQKRKLSAQPSVEALGSPQEPGLLYKPELQSVADRVRYIERANSRCFPRLVSAYSLFSC